MIVSIDRRGVVGRKGEGVVGRGGGEATRKLRAHCEGVLRTGELARMGKGVRRARGRRKISKVVGGRGRVEGVVQVVRVRGRGWRLVSPVVRWRVWRGVQVVRRRVELRGDLHDGKRNRGAVRRRVRRGRLRRRAVMRVSACEWVERRRGRVGGNLQVSGREARRRGGRCATHEAAQRGEGG
jgi:hypothetical protein